MERATDRFDRHGESAVLIGRMIPALRSIISIPAGLAGMALSRVLFFSALGTLVWTAALAAAGYLLERVSGYLNPVSSVVFGGLAIWYAYRVATFGKKSSRQAH